MAGGSGNWAATRWVSCFQRFKKEKGTAMLCGPLIIFEWVVQDSNLRPWA